MQYAGSWTYSIDNNNHQGHEYLGAFAFVVSGCSSSAAFVYWTHTYLQLRYSRRERNSELTTNPEITWPSMRNFTFLLRKKPDIPLCLSMELWLVAQYSEFLIGFYCLVRMRTQPNWRKLVLCGSSSGIWNYTLFGFMIIALVWTNVSAGSDVNEITPSIWVLWVPKMCYCVICLWAMLDWVSADVCEQTSPALW